VIVTCGQCDTQFRLGDGKVGPKGLRVRCSLCKHSFFVPPPAVASREERFEQLAREALESDLRAPEPNADLASELPASEEATAPDLGRPGRGLGPGAGGFDDDGDWKFNEEGPSEDDTQPLGLFAAAAPGGPLAPAGSRLSPGEEPGRPPLSGRFEEHASREELGSPESWDLLGSNAADSLASRAPLAPQGPAAGSPQAAGLASAELGASLREAAQALAEAPAGLLSGRLPRAAVALGWVLAAALFGAGLAGGLLPGSSPLAGTGVQEVGGLEARVARARFVENAVAGPLYVVSGELRNPGAAALQPGDRLGVRLVDAQGRDLPVPAAPLGPPKTEPELREWQPERLVREQAEGALRLAQVPLRPGQRWLFDAVLSEVPAPAAGFRFELARDGARARPAALPAAPSPEEAGPTGRDSSLP